MSRDHLLGLFWPDAPEVRARSNLRKLLSILRSSPDAIGLEITATHVRWPVDTDLRHFREALADGAPGRAVACYTGKLLDGFNPRDVPAFDAWLERERAELHDQWREAALQLTADADSRRDGAGRLEVLARLHQADPFDDTVLLGYLGALRAAGQYRRALRVFEDFRQILRDELGSEPSAAILRQVEQLREEAATVYDIQPPQVPLRQLPVRPTSFVGRQLEQARLVELLEEPDCRLVTVTGTGGVGKTRLALEVGTRLHGRFAHGVHFVPLAAATTSDHLVSAVSAALAVPSAPGDHRSRLLDHLHDKELLVILDNLERLLEAADFVSEALARSPRMKVLVTSRMPLRLYGEHEYALSPLPLPPAAPPLDSRDWTRHEAIRLFVERARSVDDAFRVTSASIGAVAEICRRLDGLPLAIELAAAHSKLLPPQVLVSRMEDRLDLLRRGARDLPARHRTLRATVDWSYDLLEVHQQRLFRRLAVFEGGWTLAAAEAVCNRRRDVPGGVLEGMACLLDHSLVYRDAITSEGDDEPRFAMLESLYEYGLEKLQEHDELECAREDHASYFVARAEEAAPHLTSAERRPWLRRLDRENDNFRAVFRWSAPRRAHDDTAPRLSAALAWFWYFRGDIDEGRRLAEEALQGGDACTAAEARALYAAGLMTWLAGDYEAARSRLARSTAIFDFLGDIEGVAVSLREAAVVAMFQNDLDASRALHERSVRLARQSGSPWHLAFGCILFGHLLLASGDDEAATPWLDESRRRFDDVGDTWGGSSALHGLGLVACRRGDHAVASGYLEQALALRRAEGDEGGCAEVLHLLAESAVRLGDLDRSAALGTECVLLYRRVSDRAGVAQALHTLGNVARLHHRFDSATRSYAAAAAEWHRLEGAYPLTLSTSGDRDRDIASARAALGNEAFATGWAAGTALGMDDAIALALAGAEP